MAEKLLKALLLYQKKEFYKVHDLIELASRLNAATPPVRSLLDDLTTLNRYYIETRYPGDYPEFSKKEALEAYESALRIKEFVLKKMEL